jgi:nucleotide-binding universal stress UspA family protein
MIRSILLALAEPPHDTGAKNYAFWLAKKVGSRIHALSIIDIEAFEVPVLGAPDGFMPSVVPTPINESQSLLKGLTELAKERIDQFSRQCESRGIPFSVEIQTGIPGEVICRTAVAHDIVVLSRSGYNRIAHANDAIDSLIAPVIKGSVRPVLVAGSAFSEGSDVRNILVAYDGSSHAARALLVASELAARPGVSCTLITVASSEDEGQEVLATAEVFLFHHGLAPKKQVVISSKPSEVICELVVSGGFDLLIMGAYGHRTIREVLFGSTTGRVLSHCAVNVVLQS